jgi:UDP-glucose:(heptosyl)LPS alpha-1,3-glucosyltransferase
MKAALAIERFSRHAGGAEAYAVDLAQTLIDNGWEVHLYGYEWDSEPTGAVFHRIRRLPGFLPASLRIMSFALYHRRMLDGTDYDVVLGFGNTLVMNVYQSHGGVHYHSTARKLHALSSPLLRGLKRVLMVMSPKYHARKWIESSAFRISPRPLIIAISDMIKRDMIDYYKADPREIRLVYNGVDVDRFRRLDRSEGEGLRARMGFTDETLFLFMAYDFRKKGVSRLLEAAASLKLNFPEQKIGVIVVGREAPGDIRNQVKRLGLEEEVRFPGPTRSPESFYAACDVFVLPTFYDACSLVVFEAMMSGLPCITTVHNGAAGIINDGVDGSVLKDPWDNEEFARVMAAYLDKEYLKQTSLKAIETARNYTLEKNHRAMLEIFEAVALRNRAQ